MYPKNFVEIVTGNGHSVNLTSASFVIKRFVPMELEYWEGTDNAQCRGRIRRSFNENLWRFYCWGNQVFGSGSGTAWIRINL